MNPTNLLSTLENYLRLANVRQQAIVTNMANVDTPGYRTRDIDFQGELKRALSNESLSAEGSAPTPRITEVSGLLERPDGNNVSLDREGLLLSETQLEYQAATQLIKGQFHQLLTAINGGSAS